MFKPQESLHYLAAILFVVASQSDGQLHEVLIRHDSFAISHHTTDVEGLALAELLTDHVHPAVDAELMLTALLQLKLLSLGGGAHQAKLSVQLIFPLIKFIPPLLQILLGLFR